MTFFDCGKVSVSAVLSRLVNNSATVPVRWNGIPPGCQKCPAILSCLHLQIMRSYQ